MSSKYFIKIICTVIQNKIISANSLQKFRSPKTIASISHKGKNRFILNKYCLEEGFSIQVAILVFLVVILGSVALASRVTSGLWGANAQSLNQEARDAAESGLLEAINEFNKVENRMLLLDDDITQQNDCYKYNSDTNAADTRSLVNPSQRAVDFLSTRTAGFRDLEGVQTPGSKRFKIQSVEYLGVDSSGNRTALTSQFRQSVLSGTQRSLIRITVVGIAQDSSGKQSFSRVAREFEVVPKCCRRSFGFNVNAGQIWGGDNRACISLPSPSGNVGVIGGLNGGINTQLASSNNTTDIKAYVANPGNVLALVDVEKGICYGGTPVGEAYPITPDPSTTNCDAGGVLSAGSLSFDSQDFTFQIPPVPSTLSRTSISNTTYYYINPGVAGTIDGQVWKSSSVGAVGSVASECTIVNSEYDSNMPGSISNYRTPITASDGTISYKREFYTVACKLSNINVSSGGSKKVFFDTTYGRFNVYFEGGSTCGSGQSANRYTCLGGSGEILRTQCLQNPTFARCGTLVTHLIYSQDLQYVAPPSSYIANRYDSSERLNFYVIPQLASPLVSNAVFEVKGTAGGGSGINIIAPQAAISVIGSGDFTGRLWADIIRFNGSATLRTIGALPPECGNAGVTCPKSATTGYDVAARSYTQATAF